jgi:hypothetical protein
MKGGPSCIIENVTGPSTEAQDHVSAVLQSATSRYVVKERGIPRCIFGRKTCGYSEPYTMFSIATLLPWVPFNTMPQHVRIQVFPPETS